MSIAETAAERPAMAVDEARSVLAPLPARLPGIDVVRAVAALAVLLSHLTLVPRSSSLSWSVAALQSALGGWGVRLFFVLSGLCIHLPLARRLASDPEARPAWGPYFQRRFTRIYPPHLVALVLSAALGLVLAPQVLDYAPITRPTWQQFALHLGMVHSFVPGAISSISAVLWSIAVETHFYLLYPLLIAARRRLGMGRLVVLLFAMAVAFRIVGIFSGESVRTVLNTNFFCSYWEWALGGWIAEKLVAKGQPRRWPTWAFAALCVGTFGAIVGLKALLRIVVGPDLARTISRDVLGLAGPLMYGLIVYVACGLAEGKSRMARGLAGLGLQSYSLYLVHPIAIALVVLGIQTLGLPELALLPVASLAGSLLLTFAFFRWVERPFLTRAAKVGTPAPAPAPAR